MKSDVRETDPRPTNGLPDQRPLSKYRRLFYTISSLLFASIITYLVAKYAFHIDNIDSLLAFIGIEIGIIALFITYWLGETQQTMLQTNKTMFDTHNAVLANHHEMLTKTVEFSEQHRILLARHSEQLYLLSEISASLGTNATIRKNMDAILHLYDHQDVNYKCMVPVDYLQKPLPLIAAGDLHALQSMQSLIGSDRLEIKILNRRQNANRRILTESSYWEGNCIYLCAPSANCALSALGPTLRIKEGTILEGQDSFLMSEVKLPVWFGVEELDEIKINGEKWMRQVLYYCSNDTTGTPGNNQPVPLYPPLISDVETDYQNAATLSSGQCPKLVSSRQKDFGLLMRLTVPTFFPPGDEDVLQTPKLRIDDRKPTRKILIISGIHQYGTWIASEVFRRVAMQKKEATSSIFFEEQDFAMVVWGEFDPDIFQVTSCGVNPNNVWQHTENVWRQLDPGAVESTIINIKSPSGPFWLS